MLIVAQAVSPAAAARHLGPAAAVASSRTGCLPTIPTKTSSPSPMAPAPVVTAAARAEQAQATHLFSADMMFESPSNHTTIFQVHTTARGAGPVYLRVDDGDIHPLNGAVFVSGLYGKWFNLKVAIDPATLQATIWINNCQKLKGVIGPRGDSVNYFKNGVYTCTSSICRDHYKNIHLYQK